MRYRKLLSALLLLLIGGVCGYAIAYWTGAPVPKFLQRARFSTFAVIDEARLRTALDASNRVMQHTATTIGRGGTIAASATLAQAIYFSRAQSLRGGAHPLPAELKELYAPYFPEGMLDKVRWTVADRRLSLGNVLAGWYLREGAVTLGNVIVFSNSKAAAHRGLVAHELTHVLQYEQLGIDDFARLYTIDWLLIEQQARRNAGRIMDEIRRERARIAQARAGPATAQPRPSAFVEATDPAVSDCSIAPGGDGVIPANCALAAYPPR